MAILDSGSSNVNLTQREVAVTVAGAIARAELPTPNGKFRNDLNHIQIDPIIIEHRVTNRVPGVRLQFMTQDRFGITLNVDLAEFGKDPGQYLRDLFEHIRPMMRNGAKLRRNKQILNEAMYEIMTEGAAANG